MSEGGREGLSLKQKLLRFAGVIGIAGAAAGGVVAVKDTISSNNQSPQEKAALELSKEGVQKIKYKVASHPDIVEAGGLAVRKEPRVPAEGDPPGVEDRYLPGKIIDGIPWVGKPAENTSAGPRDEWVAFQDANNEVRFVNKKYLAQVVEIAPNQTASK